jgi:hypothetical protein
VTSMSPDRLKRMARLPGARLDLAQEVEPPRAPPEPPPPPTAAPATLLLDDRVLADLRSSANEMADQLKQALGQQADAQERMTEMLADAIQTGMGAVQSHPPENRPRQWVFTVKRDLRGLIESIEAKAK